MKKLYLKLDSNCEKCKVHSPTVLTSEITDLLLCRECWKEEQLAQSGYSYNIPKYAKLKG